MSRSSLIGVLQGQVSLNAGNSVPRIMSNLPAVFGNGRFPSGPNMAGVVVPGRTGRRHVLQAMQGRADPLMNFNWYANMPSINANDTQNYTLSWEFVEEATLPFLEFEQVTHYRAGKNYHFPHHNSVGTLSLKFYEDSLGTTTRYLRAWQQAIYNPESGLYNYPKQYSRPIQIYILDVAQRSVMVIDYMRCWPMRFDQPQLGGASSERIIMGAEFSVDEINIKIGNFDELSMPSVMSTIGANYPGLPPALPSVFPSSFTDFSYSP